MGVPDFLKRELERRKQRNPRYSLRAFARDLDCDHATLSQWMRGTRTMSSDAEHGIFARLDLSPIERQRARELEDLDFRVLGGIGSQAPRRSRDIAGAAGVTVDQVNVSMTKLVRLGLLRLEGSQWIITEEAK